MVELYINHLEKITSIYQPKNMTGEICPFLFNGGRWAVGGRRRSRRSRLTASQLLKEIIGEHLPRFTVEEKELLLKGGDAPTRGRGDGTSFFGGFHG